MKIGVVGDTHDNLANVREIAAHARVRGAES